MSDFTSAGFVAHVAGMPLHGECVVPGHGHHRRDDERDTDCSYFMTTVEDAFDELEGLVVAARALVADAAKEVNT